jgi:hypothetical protein
MNANNGGDDAFVDPQYTGVSAFIGCAAERTYGKPLDLHVVHNPRADVPLRLGSLGAKDDEWFVLTLTPQYVARASGKTPPVSFHEIERYADENAGDLREMAFREKATGRLNLTLE